MRVILIFTMAVIHWTLSIFNPALGQDDSLLVGEVRAIAVPFEIRSILNGSDEVVNLNVEGPRTLILTGITPGRTNVIVFGSTDERLDLSISITADLRDLVFLHEGASNSVTFRCDKRCTRDKNNEEGSSNSSSLGGLPPTSGSDSAAR
jgi:hypothetical protein